jgi:hypothetical protein
VRVLGTALVLILLCVALACGDNSTPKPTSGSLSGNWEITLNRHASTVPQVFSGFLLQSGNSIGGSVILGGGCQGVGPVTGTLDNQQLSLTIHEFGQDVTLVGSAPSSSGFLGGDFSTLPGGCTEFPNTGTWSAQMIPPFGGSFHGTLTSASNGTVSFSGNLTQGPNTGDSNAALSGNLATTGSPQFCSYLTSASITGLISGTAVTLNLFGSDGVQITQINATAAADATSITGPYIFQKISDSCFGDQGTIQITFP